MTDMGKKPYKKAGHEPVPRMIPMKYRHETTCAIEQSYTNGVFDTLRAAYKFLSPEDFLSLVIEMKLGFEHFMEGEMEHLKYMASLQKTITISDLIIDAKNKVKNHE